MRFEEAMKDETPAVNKESLFSGRIQTVLDNMGDALYKKILNTTPIANTDIPETEDDDMYKNLEITFKSGETITYKPGEWDDYSFTGSAVVVKKNGAWIGIYNFDHVFCVELKK